MQPRFSQLLSYIFHPIFVPLLSVILVIVLPFWAQVEFSQFSMGLLIFLVISFTVLLPVIASLVLIRLKIIDSFTMIKREHRNIPLLITSSSYLAMIYVLKYTGTPSVLLYILYTALFALLVGMLVNLVYKISLHTLGWGGMAASFSSLMVETGYNLIFIVVGAIAVAGIVGYARLNEKAHSNWQVYAGFGLGFFSILALTMLGK